MFVMIFSAAGVLCCVVLIAYAQRCRPDEPRGAASCYVLRNDTSEPLTVQWVNRSETEGIQGPVEPGESVAFYCDGDLDHSPRPEESFRQLRVLSADGRERAVFDAPERARWEVERIGEPTWPTDEYTLVMRDGAWQVEGPPPEAGGGQALSPQRCAAGAAAGVSPSRSLRAETSVWSASI